VVVAAAGGRAPDEVGVPPPGHDPFAAAEAHLEAVVAHVLGAAAPAGLVLETDALLGEDGCSPPDGPTAPGKGWLIPHPSGTVLVGVVVQPLGAVGGEGGKVRAAVDDLARPDDGVRGRVGDLTRLVPRDGGLDVCTLRGEFAGLEDDPEMVETLLDGLDADGGGPVTDLVT